MLEILLLSFGRASKGAKILKHKHCGCYERLEFLESSIFLFHQPHSFLADFQHCFVKYSNFYIYCLIVIFHTFYVLFHYYCYICLSLSSLDSKYVIKRYWTTEHQAPHFYRSFNIVLVIEIFWLMHHPAPIRSPGLCFQICQITILSLIICPELIGCSSSEHARLFISALFRTSPSVMSSPFAISVHIYQIYIYVIKFLSAIGCDTKLCRVLTNHSQVNKHLVPYFRVQRIF